MPNVAIRLAVDGTAQVKNAFTDVQQSGTAALRSIETGADKASAAADKLAARWKAMAAQAREQQQAEAARSQFDAFLGVGGGSGKSAKESASVFAGMTDEAEATRGKVKEVAEEIGGLSRNQMQELAHSGRAIFDMLQAGIPVTQALRVEGARIVQALGSGEGGVMGSVKAIGSGLLGLLTPARVALGGVAAIGLAAALSYNQWRGAQDALRSSLEGVGKQAGATIDQLNAVARAGASVGRISLSESIGLTAGFTSQGIGPGVTQQAVGYTPAFARVTGQDVDAAGGQLAKALRDPSSGAVDLNRSLGFLDGAVRKTIDDLVAQGRIEEARSTLSDAVNRALADTADKTTALGKAMEFAKGHISDFFAGIGKSVSDLINGQSTGEQISGLQTRLANLLSANRNEVDPQALDEQIAAVRKELEPLLARQADENRKTADQKTEQDNSALTLQATDVIKRLLPDIVRANDTSNDIRLLQSVISNPDVLNRLGVTASQASDALRNTVVRSQFSDPDTAARNEQDLAMRSLNDYTLAERAATEARRAAISVLKDTGDVVRASTAAENARNLLIEKANQEASDRADLAEQNARLVGLTPYARGRQEIENRYSGVGGYDKDEITTRQIAESMKPAQDAIKQGGDYFLDKVSEAAMRIAKAAGIVGDGSAPNALPMFAGGAVSAKAVGGVTPAMIEATKQYMAAGYGLNAAAGFVGGLTNESGTSLDPNAVNDTGHKGIAQWDRSRWGSLYSALGGGIRTRSGQIAGSIGELSTTESRAGGMLAAADSVVGGVLASDAYERPGDAEALRRRGLAVARGQAIVQAFQGAPDLTIRKGANDNQGGEEGGVAAGGRAAAASVSNARAKAAELGAYDQEQQQEPLRAANQSVADQVRMLDAQRSAVGKTADQIKGLIAAQTLLNQLNDKGVPVSADLAAGIKAYGDNVAKASAEASAFDKQQKDIVGSLDLVRDTSKGALDTLVQGIRNGESAGKILQSVFDGILSKVLNLAENQLIDNLFGKQGTAQGGLLGGSGGGLMSIVSSLFGGGGAAGTATTLLGNVGGIGHAASGASSISGLVEVGEAGPEIVDTAPGSRVISNTAAFGQTAQASAPQGPRVQVFQAPGTNITTKESRGPSMDDLVEVHVENALMKGAQTNSKGFRAFAARATSRAG